MGERSGGEALALRVPPDDELCLLLGRVRWERHGRAQQRHERRDAAGAVDGHFGLLEQGQLGQRRRRILLGQEGPVGRLAVEQRHEWLDAPRAGDQRAGVVTGGGELCHRRRRLLHAQRLFAADRLHQWVDPAALGDDRVVCRIDGERERPQRVLLAALRPVLEQGDQILGAA